MSAVINLTENSVTPGTPSAGVLQIYSMNDDKLYYQTSGGSHAAFGTGDGTVTSVAVTAAGFSVGGSPITTSGTISLTSGGSNGDVLTSDGAGGASWLPGGGGTPSLSNHDIGYGDASNLLTGVSYFRFYDNTASPTLQITGTTAPFLNLYSSTIGVAAQISVDNYGGANYDRMKIHCSGPTTGINIDTNGQPLFISDNAGTSGQVLTTQGAGSPPIWSDPIPVLTGQATLVGGTVTVLTASVHTASNVFLTTVAVGGTIGIQYVNNIVDGVSFDIVSTNVLDTSTVSWMITT